MKTILFLLTLTLVTLTASAQTNKISQLPVATAIISGDVVLINETNPASPTGFTSKTISYANFVAALVKTNQLFAFNVQTNFPLPLASFCPVLNGGYIAQSVSPFVIPSLIFGGTNINCYYDLPVPNYITNLNLNLKILWSGNSPLIITNGFTAFYCSPVGRINSPVVSAISTLSATGETWIAAANLTWPDTNASKWVEIQSLKIGFTNNSFAYITAAWGTTTNAVFRGTNF